MRAHSSAVVLDDRQRGVEVVAQATRRRFTAEYKLRVLREADACTEPGEIGAVLRRGGIVHLPSVPLAQAAADEGAHRAHPRQTRPGAEGDESAGGEGGGIGEEDAVADRSR